jgi:threonine/homoserine/homoserine lactone efflux protein
MIAAFLLASLLLAVSPGPAVVYLLTRTLAHGRRAGFASIGGIALGNLGNALGASIGLAALFAASSAAFTAVRLAGALYLVYLGIRALRPAAVGPLGLPPEAPRAAKVFRAGFVVALLNPKTALFFAAFLPQFIDPSSGPPMVQSVVLGGLFVAVAAVTDSIYVLVSSRLASGLESRMRGGGRTGPGGGAATSARFARVGRSGRYLSAATFIGLGIWTAFASPRAGT